MTKVYIITHKPFQRRTDEKIYEPLVVGAYKNIVDYPVKDNVGDNISIKNADFCELTGQYWIWKNDHSDITGLTHYRRYFYKNGHILTEGEIKKALRSNDIIVAGKQYVSKPIYDIYKESNLQPYLNKLMDLLKAEYPEYYAHFDISLKKNYTYPCNMLICRKDIFDGYSQWMFEVLFKLEEKINSDENIKKQARAYGYLSENMLMAYIMKNSLKFTTYPVYNTEVGFAKQVILSKFLSFSNTCKALGKRVKKG